MSGSPHCILKLSAAGVWDGRRSRARDVSDRRASSQRLYSLGQRSDFPASSRELWKVLNQGSSLRGIGDGLVGMGWRVLRRDGRDQSKGLESS